MNSRFTRICLLTASLLLFVSVINISGKGGGQRDGNLMPRPMKVEWKSGRFALNRDFGIGFKGADDDRLRDYAARVLRRLRGRTVMSPPVKSSDILSVPQLFIETGSAGNRIPQLGEDESYLLDVDSDRITLTANTNIGAMRGLETLLQLLERDRDGFYFPKVLIEDQPRFPWRGLMIDIARHFQPMEVLKRNLDAMAAVKLNVFHWHLTEDQGFRVESKKFPKLHTLGSDGNFYTQKEIEEVVNYATDRGIRVVPEFDMPGHATAWLVGHPEFASLPGPYKIERNPGIFDPTLNPIKEETYQFLDVFLTEMAGLFPDNYMHIGGDENEGKQWDANPEIQAFMTANGMKNNHDLQTHFNKRVLKILQKNKKIMMGWDEIFQPELPKDVVIHSWRGQEALAEAARQGYSGVLSNGYYIDLMEPASSHYLVDPLPAGTKLSSDEQKRVLGGEATMWSEWVSPETIDSRIWMRTAAIAERLWSQRDVKDVDDMYRRLDILSVQLEELGLTHRKNQAVLLRRLIGGSNITALKTLVSVIEPVKQYQRYQQRPQTMLDPLTGLIDAAQADAPGGRSFRMILANLISDREDSRAREKLREMFIAWRDAGNELTQTTKDNPGLNEAQPLAVDLHDLGVIGLELLSYMEKGKSPEPKWLEATQKRLDEIKKPKAALEFVVVETLEKLIAAMSE